MVLDYATTRRFHWIRDNLCTSCSAYKPKQPSQCPIWSNLLTNPKKDMLDNESCFLDGFSCKGFSYSEKNEEKHGKKKRWVQARQAGIKGKGANSKSGTSSESSASPKPGEDSSTAEPMETQTLLDFLESTSK